MSPPGGFTYNGVMAIQQDKDGFIWVQTDEEIYSFDGYEYKRHSAYFYKINPAIHWRFFKLISDRSGEIVVSTNHGIYQYNRVLDKFDMLTEQQLDPMFVDLHNQLWIRKEALWGKLRKETGEIEYPDVKQNTTKFGSVYCVHNQDLYIFSNTAKVFRYNHKKNDFTLCFSFPANTSIQGAQAYKGKLWVFANESTLYKIDLAGFTIEEETEIWDKNLNYAKRTFFIDKNGNVWIGTINGLFLFNTSDKTIKHYLHSETNQFSLPNNSVWTITGDNRNNIWIGTYSGAISYVNLDEKNPFETYRPVDKKLNHAPVSAFAEDRENLWIGTEGGGVNKINKITGSFTYLSMQSAIAKLSSNNIKSLVVDKAKNLWIGTYTGGLDCLNLNSGRVRNYKNTGDFNALKSNNIRKIVLDNDSGLWIAYQQQKLEISFLSFKSNKFTHYDFSEGVRNVYIYDLMRGGENQLWLLTKEKLYLLDLKTKKLQEVQPGQKKFLNFNTFCLDDSGNIWIGTIGNGLVKYNPANDELKVYSDILKYNISAVFNICYDAEGYLWMGTDNGLISYNISTNESRRFNKNDGLQGDVYYPLATMKGLDNRLYFGGTNGFSVLKPHELSTNVHKPHVMISGFYIDNKPAKLNIENKKETNQIVLKYNQNNFGFKFSSDNFLIPQKTLYKYRLRGYDDRWIEVDAGSRTAFYSKVPAGVYYFEVLAANNDGVWNTEPMVLKIIQRPAPWFSAWAIFFYVVLVLLFVIWIFRYYKAKKDLELQLYVENVEKQKKEEIHQSQLRFFTNISHDFRTPLSLIIASLERLRSEGLKEYYYRILNSNAQRLLNLVNELMDFRALEHSKVKLELKLLNLNEFVWKIAADFSDFARQKNISFEINCDKQLPEQLYFDKNVVEKVVMNLLNNAFKHTPEGGRIEISTNLGKFESQHKNSFVVNGDYIPKSCFNITVSDTGVGISKESIQTVFERFYKVSSGNLDSHLGTGIGLALVKSLVLLHRGKITIYSERSVGTDISVEFSLSDEMYEPDCFADEIEEPEAEEETVMISKDINSIIQNTNQKNKKKILFAEDNEALRNLIADYLSNDFEIIQAVDGLMAKRILSKRVIDLIISDIMMPNVDGISFCKDIKSNIETSHIPIILLTAKSGVESKLEGVDSGADYYFEKPVSPELLNKTIHNIFKQQQQLKEFYAKNHFADSSELTSNERDAEFLNKFVSIIDKNLHQSDMDVNNIATEMSMSRSKLYRKVKTMTDMSIIEFILSYKLKKAAKLLIEKDLSIREIMDEIGIESQPYFSNAFKKEFGETPTAFAARHRNVT